MNYNDFFRIYVTNDAVKDISDVIKRNSKTSESTQDNEYSTSSRTTNTLNTTNTSEFTNTSGSYNTESTIDSKSKSVTKINTKHFDNSFIIYIAVAGYKSGDINVQRQGNVVKIICKGNNPLYEQGQVFKTEYTLEPKYSNYKLQKPEILNGVLKLSFIKVVDFNETYSV